MRIRSIKPEFFKHDKVAELAPLTRLLFISLWCAADCKGRLEDRPKRLQVECLPYDKCDVDAMLWELHKAGFIERYEVGETKIIQIMTFEKHQRITGKESTYDSDLPEHQLGNIRETPGCCTDAQERKGKERKGARKGDSENEIETIYQAYPRKIAKIDGLKAIERALRKIDAPSLLASTQSYARSCTGKDPQYIPHPATWFNAGRWEDEGIQSSPLIPITFHQGDLDGIDPAALARL